MPLTAFWLIVFIALVAGEAATMGLTSIWFAVGALGGLLAASFGGPLWFQLVVFVVLSAAALATVRPIAARHFRPRHAATNADRVVGKSGLVTETIDNSRTQGQVKVLGQIWTARSEQDVVIPQGTQVRVLRIEGVKVFVEAE
ncbi:MAG: NfeD family protein [Lawsonibacter sp.]|nr:NfeD family protein [Lawsonibacter sp.]